MENLLVHRRIRSLGILEFLDDGFKMVTLERSYLLELQ